MRKICGKKKKKVKKKKGPQTEKKSPKQPKRQAERESRLRGHNPRHADVPFQAASALSD